MKLLEAESIFLRGQLRPTSFSMPDAFRQFYLDCEGKQSIEQLCLSIKMAVSQLIIWNLFAATVPRLPPGVLVDVGAHAGAKRIGGALLDLSALAMPTRSMVGDGLRNEDYLRLKILTCMLPEL